MKRRRSFGRLVCIYIEAIAISLRTPEHEMNKSRKARLRAFEALGFLRLRVSGGDGVIIVAAIIPLECAPHSGQAHS